MKLNLEHPFTLGDLIYFVKKERPATLEMTPGQLKHYRNVVRQKVGRTPYKFMGVVIEEYGGA